jgi:hypothetical protein
MINAKSEQKKIHSEDVPYVLGPELGRGVFGTVYQLADHPDKVIKISKSLSVKKDGWNISAQSFYNCKRLFKTLKAAKLKTVAKIYDYKLIKNGNQYFFYYIAEMLNSIDDNNKYIDFREKYSGKYVSKKHKLKFLDCHRGNVMSDKKGKLKICDLDGIWIKA